MAALQLLGMEQPFRVVAPCPAPGKPHTPARSTELSRLKTAGPLSIYALAKRLGRHYRNVHKDVTALVDWMVIEKDESGRVFVPWDEIDVRWPLIRKAA